MSHPRHSVVFSDTKFSFATWISGPSQWNDAGVATCIRVETGNASMQCSLDEPNARALIVALEDHIKNISHVKNELTAIQQIQKKEATA